MSVTVKKKEPSILGKWDEVNRIYLETAKRNGVNQAKLLVRVDTSNLRGSISGVSDDKTAEWGSDVRYALFQEGFKDVTLRPRQTNQETGGYTPFLRPSLMFVKKNTGLFYSRAIRKVYR